MHVRVCVGPQADRSAGRLTGSMMELQTLQEALKVEIQIHQVGSLSRPLGQWVRRRLLRIQMFPGQPQPERTGPVPVKFSRTQHLQMQKFPAQPESFSPLCSACSAALHQIKIINKQNILESSFAKITATKEKRQGIQQQL